MRNENQRLVTVDFGGNKGYVYDTATGKTREFKVIHKVLDFLRTLPAGTQVVGEYAHLGVPMTRRSRAQMFSADELTSLYADLDKNGVDIRFWPQTQTPKARDMAANAGVISRSKTDENDARAIAWHVQNVGTMPLMKPRTGRNGEFTFDASPRRKHGNAVVSHSNMTANQMRRFKYRRIPGEYGDALLDFVAGFKDQLLTLSEDAVSFLDITASKSALKKGELVANRAPVEKSVGLWNLLLTVATEVDGEVQMITYGGKPLGWNCYRTVVLHLGPNHLKGGVVRSTLMSTRFRNWSNKYAQKNFGVEIPRKGKPGSFGDPRVEEAFQAARKAYKKALREVYRLLVRVCERENLNRVEGMTLPC